MIEQQAKRLAKGASSQRKARIKEIAERYKDNMGKNEFVKYLDDRNAYLRSIINGETERPTRNELTASYRNGTPWRFVNDSKLSDNQLRGLIGKNTYYKNRHPFTRSEYMYGEAHKSLASG